jgi:hypothetical protein
LKEIMMKRNRGFDEVMIVNPYEPGSNANQGVRFMRFYAAPPGMGYYAEPPADYGYYAQAPVDYGYYAQAPVDYGYYAEAPNDYGYYAEAPVDYGYYAAPSGGYGYYAQAPGGYGYYAAPADGYGYYANLPEQFSEVEPGYNEYEPVGYVAGGYPMGYYGDPYAGYQGDQEPVGYYGHYGQPTGYYAEAPDAQGYQGYGPVGYYAEAPEMPGYAQYEPMAEAYPEMAGYGASGQEYAGYVRETDPAFNPGCPMPTNVHGFGDPNMVEGYVKPSTVNPMCGQFTPQPGQEAATPDTFKPLW